MALPNRAARGALAVHGRRGVAARAPAASGSRSGVARPAPVTAARARLAVPLLAGALALALLLRPPRAAWRCRSPACCGARREARPERGRGLARRDRRRRSCGTVRLPRVLLAALVGGGPRRRGGGTAVRLPQPAWPTRGCSAWARARLLERCSPCTLGLASAVFLGAAARRVRGSAQRRARRLLRRRRLGPHEPAWPAAHRDRRLGARRRAHLGDAGRDRGVPREDGAVLARGRARGPRLDPRPGSPRSSCCRGLRCWCCSAARSTCCRSARRRPRRSGCPCARRASGCSAWPRSSPEPRRPRRARSPSSA